MERGESGNILFTRSEFADCVLQPTDFATLVTDIGDQASSERLSKIAGFAKTMLGVDVRGGEALPLERGLITVPESVARTLLEDLVKTIDAVNDDDTGEGWVLPKGLKDPALERCVHLRATLRKLLSPEAER